MFPACLSYFNRLHSNSTHFSSFSWQYYAISCQTCLLPYFFKVPFIYIKNKKSNGSHHTSFIGYYALVIGFCCYILKVLCSLTKYSKYSKLHSHFFLCALNCLWKSTMWKISYKFFLILQKHPNWYERHTILLPKTHVTSEIDMWLNKDADNE